MPVGINVKKAIIKEWQLSSPRITVWVATDNDLNVIAGAPVIKRFIGRNLFDLCRIIQADRMHQLPQGEKEWSM